MRWSAKITSKGQITIPRAIRTHMGLKTGDFVVFEQGDHGVTMKKARVAPVIELETLTGRLARRLRGREVTAEDVSEAVRWARGRL